VLEPKTVDIPGKNDLVQGRYPVPDDAGTIRIKITDLLSESLEKEVTTLNLIEHGYRMVNTVV
jgi:adenine-specific DNA-methyltransferase